MLLPTGYTPFPFERPAGDQTTQQHSVLRPARRGSQQKVAIGTKSAVSADNADPTKATSAHTADLFAGSEALQDRVPIDGSDGQRQRFESAAAVVVPRSVAGQQPISPARRQARIADDIAHPTQPITQRGGKRRVRPHARPHRVPGDEPGRDQIGRETQRQLQASERHQPPGRGQVSEHAGSAAKGPQRKRSR